MRPLLFLFALLWLLVAPLAAQGLRIEYFTVNDGLSAREINDLHIGADGFLWVATIDGLNRFDGHTFLSFGPRDLFGSRLSRGAIEGIRADNEGKLVITYRDFLGYFDRFDPRDFSVEQVPILPSNGVLGYPRDIATDRYGRTFVVTIGTEGTTLYEHTPAGFTVIYSQPEDGWLSFAPRFDLLPLDNGQFLLYDEEHGFRHVSATGQELGTFFPKTSNQRRFYTMRQAGDGYVYLSFRDGYPLYRWSPDRLGGPQPVPGLDDGLRYPRMFADELGQLLLPATEDILGQEYPDEYYLVDTMGGFGLFEPQLPTDRLVSAVAAKDFNRTVYLGLREGLGVMERYVHPVKSFLVSDGDALYRSAVRGISADTVGNVFIIEENGTFHRMPPDRDSLLPQLLLYEDGQPVSLRDARQLVYDPEAAVIWGIAHPTGVNGKGGVLFRFDPQTFITRTYPSEFPLTCLGLGPEGELYLGASDPRRVGLLLRFDRRREAFSTVALRDETGEAISGLRINYLLSSRNGSLLIGTRNRGLLAYRPDRRVVISYRDVARYFNETTIYTIHEDGAGNWWLGTDGGLFRFQPDRGEVSHFGRQEGLSSNTVVGIVPDSTAGLWLSTGNGLVHFSNDGSGEQFRRYYLEDGLTNDAFNPFAAFRDSGGRYFFGGENGLTVFRERDFNSASAGSDVMLTEVIIYGRAENEVYNNRLDELREVTLGANEKSIAISFALPVGQRPGTTQFRVKLEGFNDNWRELRNERTVRYNNLPAGKYRLLVQGAGANGNYGERLLELGITVRQHLIEQLWFQGLIVLLIVGLFVGILQARLRERLRNEQLRTQLSSDIHDEVSGLLAGITLQAELLKNRTEDETLRKRLHTVGEAGRNAMSKMSDVIWSIDSRRDTIGNLLQRMQEHADEVLLPLDIRYEFRASGFDEDKELPGTIRQDVYFIYKEAINNIARHSNATRVNIELEQFAQTFEMFIRDNGTGQAAHQPITASRFTPKTGQGKDNMRMRATRLRGELTIDDRMGYTLTLRTKRLA